MSARAAAHRIQIQQTKSVRIAAPLSWILTITGYLHSLKLRKRFLQLPLRGMILKTIDRYILKKFLGTFIFSIVLIICIVIIFDISEKIDNFIHASLHEIIFDHYLNFIPYFANRLSPLFTFISIIFFTSKM